MLGLLLCVFVTQTFAVRVCDNEKSVDLSFSGYNISSEGTLTTADGHVWENNEYFSDGKGLRGCYMCKETSAMCLRKCCTFGYGYNPVKKACLVVSEEFDPPLYDEYTVVEGLKANSRFTYITGKQNCHGGRVRLWVGQTGRLSHLRQDGTLYVESEDKVNPGSVYPANEYCVDTFVFPDGTKRLDALICFKAEEDGEDSDQYLQNSICMLISCFFILLTCAVYAFLPELRNLHGRVLITNLLCFFVGFGMMATMQILLLLEMINSKMCIQFTFVIYFAITSAFFWLNVMCFDIWWTFSGKRGLSLEKLSTRGRYFAYAAYAFGCPTLLTALVAALEFSGLPEYWWLPLLRVQGCFISGWSKFIYLYTPMLTLCFANLVFFILTAVKIAQIKQQTSVLKSRESSTHDQHRNDKQRLVLYIKLFAVTGINWVFEAFSSSYPGTTWILRVMDAYNVLLGLIIFIIFVCKKKIFHLVKKRIKHLRGDPMSRTTTTTSTRTVSKEEVNQVSIKLR